MWANKRDVERIELQLAELKYLLLRAMGQEHVMSQNLDHLRHAVEQQTTAVQSAQTLIAGLSQQIRDAAANNDQAALEDLANQIDANSVSLAQAVAANTTDTGQPQPDAPNPATAPGDTGNGTTQG